jgi:hypothetical protein
MSNHVFHPSIELADHVLGYAHGLKAHNDDYGDVPGSSPGELKPLEHDAEKLLPLAEKLHELELQVAAQRERYNRAAAPLWTAFSEKIQIARTHAEKQQKHALLAFVRTFQHHAQRHRAAKEAGALHVPGEPATTAK